MGLVGWLLVEERRKRGEGGRVVVVVGVERERISGNLIFVFLGGINHFSVLFLFFCYSCLLSYELSKFLYLFSTGAI